MLQADFYLMARHEARFHVQVEVITVSPVERTPGPVRLDARVIQVFRGDRTLKAGDRVTFEEHVMRPGDSIPCGGILWKEGGALQQARYLEVFLNGDPPECAVPLCQSEVIAAPSNKARMRGWYPLVATRQRAFRLLARRQAASRPWWRFWE